MTSLQTASLEDMREVAARICRDYLTGQWKCITSDDIVVKRISGGLSNFLYYVSLPEDGSSGNGSNSTTSVTDTERADGDGHSRKRQRSNSGEIMHVDACVPNATGKVPREVLLRIYGQTHGENALESMISESVVFALLSERNFGPKLMGIFPGGRIEQYIPARALATVELSEYKISMKIAEKMGEIHSLNIPMSKEPDWLWNCMDRWLKNIVAILETSDSKKAGAYLEEVRAFDFWEEGKWLKTVIDSGNYPVLFCHNDFQEGNILYRESAAISSATALDTFNTSSTSFDDSAHISAEDVSMRESDLNANASILHVEGGTMRKRLLSPNYAADLDNTRDSVLSNNSEDCDPDLIIIDFEYCAYNYRGFDLANHFLEWTFDYTNSVFPFYFHRKLQYPTQQQRKDFIVSYLKKLNESTEAYTPSVNEVQAVDNEVRIFSMFSHLFWSLWSVMNVNSNIEFGYCDYAVTRIREYQQLKQEYLSKTI